MERLTISMDSWQKTAIERISREQEISVSELLRNVLTDFLKESKPNHLRPLVEIPDSDLSDFDKAVKAWCQKELNKMANWYLDDLKN